MATNDLTQAEASQKRIQSFAFVIAASVCVILGSCLAVSNLLGPARECNIKLDEMINPNDAPLGSLLRLPGVGIAKAGAIVAYREDFCQKDSTKPAFQTIDDLQKVKGIGPKTVRNMSQWLKFERK